MEKINIVGDLYLRTKIRHCDLHNLLINLEYPITRETTPFDENKIVLKGIEDPLDGLDVFGVVLANNHIFDLGPKGVADTIAYLDKKNLPFIGLEGDPSFRSYLEYECYRIYTCCHQSSNPVWSCGRYSITRFNLKEISHFVSEALEAGKKAVVCIHWGLEHVIYPTEEMRRIAEQIVGMGASIIIGHHSHVPMSKERIGDSTVYYGLGNFAFDNVESNLANYTYTYRQKRINKKSIVVSLSEGGVEDRFVVYSNHSVNLAKGKISERNGNALRYQKRLIRWKKIINFVKNPNHLSIEKIKRF